MAAPPAANPRRPPRQLATAMASRVDHPAHPRPPTLERAQLDPHRWGPLPASSSSNISSSSSCSSSSNNSMPPVCPSCHSRRSSRPRHSFSPIEGSAEAEVVASRRTTTTAAATTTEAVVVRPQDLRGAACRTTTASSRC